MKECDIYLDYAATTPTDKDVFAVAAPFFTEIFYNPASTHAAGQKAAAAVERSRELCAHTIGAKPHEIYFTSGGTEAVNAALFGVRKNKKRIVVSTIEHDSVSACAGRLAADGFDVVYVKPNGGCTVTPDALERAMTDDTALVCVMTVNNITGAIQPVKELAAVAHRHGALFFTDAVQAVNTSAINVNETGVDMLALSGHKFYSPKGVGLLYVRSGVEFDGTMLGGEQEHGKRAGTPDVSGIVAFGEALTAAARRIDEYNASVGRVADAFLNALSCGEVVKCDNKTCDIMSIVFDGINGGRLAVALSCEGVYCSVGSACSAGSATPPRTLTEMGIKNADKSVRFSFGRDTTVEQATAAAKIVNKVVARLSSNK